MNIVDFTAEVVCSLEAWHMGIVWMEHPGNCHLYFACELVYRNKFRMHGIDCGELFWNQHTLLCEDSLDPLATCDNVVNVPQAPKPFACKWNHAVCLLSISIGDSNDTYLLIIK